MTWLLEENTDDLQLCLDTLYDYCIRWKLLVHTDKTKIMIFRKRGRLANGIQFKYGNNKVEIVSMIVYLGILFTSTGSYTEMQK